jgi:hypothetical protein
MFKQCSQLFFQHFISQSSNMKLEETWKKWCGTSPSAFPKSVITPPIRLVRKLSFLVLSSLVPNWLLLVSGCSSRVTQLLGLCQKLWALHWTNQPAALPHYRFLVSVSVKFQWFSGMIQRICYPMEIYWWDVHLEHHAQCLPWTLDPVIRCG